MYMDTFVPHLQGVAGSSLLQLMDRFAFSSHILQLTNESDTITELESEGIGEAIYS